MKPLYHDFINLHSWIRFINAVSPMITTKKINESAFIYTLDLDISHANTHICKVRHMLPVGISDPPSRFNVAYNCIIQSYQ